MLHSGHGSCAILTCYWTRLCFSTLGQKQRGLWQFKGSPLPKRNRCWLLGVKAPQEQVVHKTGKGMMGSGGTLASSVVPQVQVCIKGRTDFGEQFAVTVIWGGGSPGGSDSKESACNAGGMGLTPGSGRSPGEGNGYPLQYSCLENPMDRGTWGTQSMESQRVRQDWRTNTFTFFHHLRW